MDLLRQQLQRIQEQMGALTASQRMLAFSLVAIMVMTLIWWGRYAATPEMVPVVNRSLSASEMVNVRSALVRAAVPVREVNDRLMVPAERQIDAIVILSADKLLPDDSADVWDDIINKQSSPWETAEKYATRHNRYKELLISQGLRKHFPNVTSAQVILDPTSKRRIGVQGDLQPVASVLLSVAGEAEHKRIAEGAAAIVAASTSGLQVQNVTVSINGKPNRARDPAGGGMSSSDLYESIEYSERHFVNKIRSEALPHIPAALVTVSVDVESISSQETRHTYDPDKTFSKERSSETDTMETVSRDAAPQQEPGAQANMPIGAYEPPASASTGSASTTTTEKNRTQMEVFASHSVEQLIKPSGRRKVLRAAVRLPESYFVMQYKTRNPSASEPSEEDLLPLIERQLKQVREQVIASCGDIDEDAVSVSTYWDVPPPMAAVADSGGGASAGVSGLISSHVKEIAIGTLAVISLFMVTTMFRRAAPITTVTAPIELREVTPLATDEDIAGEVGEGSAMLDGMELDEDTIKAQQMVEQVSTMVKENPDAAANLVKRWLNRS